MSLKKATKRQSHLFQSLGSCLDAEQKKQKKKKTTKQYVYKSQAVSAWKSILILSPSAPMIL